MKQYHLTAANGMIVSVQEDRLGAWIKGQEQILDGTYRSDERLTKEILAQIRRQTKKK